MKKNVIIGSGLCPLAVHINTQRGVLSETVKDRIKALKLDIRHSGRLFEEYPQSLFDEIMSWEDLVESESFKIEGARSSIFIPLNLIKSYCGNSVECYMAYIAGEQNAGATKLIEDSMKVVGITPLFDYLQVGKGDSQVDVMVHDGISAHPTARMYQSSKTAFKYKFNLSSLESRIGTYVDTLMLNRAAKGVKFGARSLLERNNNSLVTYRVHNYSRRVGAKENAEMFDWANFIFFTDTNKDGTILNGMKKVFSAENFDELARKILSINSIKRIVVMPPETGVTDNIRFFMTDIDSPAEVNVPDYEFNHNSHIRTAALNGACVALTCGNFAEKQNIKLLGRFPSDANELQKFAEAAIKIAYEKIFK